MKNSTGIKPKSSYQVLKFALQFAARGWHVFPQRRSKKPCIKDWSNKASTVNERIRAWAKQFPKGNFAVACGRKSGIIGLDVDVKNGGHGKASLILLRREHGKIKTLTVKTPSGGWHLYFQYPDGFTLMTTFAIFLK